MNSCNKIDSLIKRLDTKRKLQYAREFPWNIDYLAWKKYFQPLFSLLMKCELTFAQQAIFFSEITLDKDKLKEIYIKLGIPEKFIPSLYYASGRPKVDMRIYLGYLDVEVYIDKPKGRILDNESYICVEPNGVYEDVYLPVVRYQTGMSGYLTVPSEEEKDWCGTFYYFDPQESSMRSGNCIVYLLSHTCLVSWNKMTACYELGLDLDIVVDLLVEGIGGWVWMDPVTEQTKPLTPRLAGYEADTWEEVVLLYINKKANPLVHHVDMYAKEDLFDQPLCLLAREKGIDVIVLKYMTGETRVVSEVIDTRERIESFSHLLFDM